MTRYYSADGNALVADMDALYGPENPGHRYGDYTHLAGPNPWRNFDPGFFPYPRVECGAEPAKSWPMPEQERLL